MENNQIQEIMLLLEESERITNSGSWFWNPKTNEVIWSKNLYNILGYDPAKDTPSVENYFKAIHPEDLEAHKKASEESVSNNEVSGSHTARIVHPNGDIHFIRVKGSSIKNSEGEIERIVGIVENVTSELKNIEEEKELVRLKTINMLTAGVAHDFNNYLQIIMGNIGLLNNKVSDEYIVSKLQNINLATVNASELIQKVLELGHRENESSKPWCLNEFYEKNIDLFKSLVTQNITLHYSVEKDLETIIPKDEFAQILINLIKNSKEAMNSKGELFISMNNKDNEFVLEVKDTGPGISDDIKEQIFDPFFTTKDDRRGTGLGLSSTRSLVMKNLGSIHVNNSEQGGAIFTLKFPMVQGQSDACESESDPLSRVEKDNYRILIVEDNEDVREMLEFALIEEQIVVVAENGQEGLDIYKSRGPFDLIISDINMPKMNGDEMGNHIWRLNPDQKIIFLTGYQEDIQEKELIGKHTILNKPIDLTMLFSYVADFLKD